MKGLLVHIIATSSHGCCDDVIDVHWWSFPREKGLTVFLCCWWSLPSLPATSEHNVASCPRSRSLSLQLRVGSCWSGMTALRLSQHVELSWCVATGLTGCSWADIGSSESSSIVQKNRIQLLSLVRYAEKTHTNRFEVCALVCRVRWRSGWWAGICIMLWVMTAELTWPLYWNLEMFRNQIFATIQLNI